MTESANDTLLGQWKVVSCHIGGIKNDANVGTRIEVRDRTIYDYHRPQPIVYEYTTDNTQTPHRMTWKMIGVDTGGTLQRLPVAIPPAAGIYELVDDTLRFCWSNPGRPFPTDFTTGKDSNHHSYVYRRCTQADG